MAKLMKDGQVVRCSVKGVGGSGRFGLLGRHQCSNYAVVERPMNQYGHAEATMQVFCTTHDPVAKDVRYREKMDEKRDASDRLRNRQYVADRIVDAKNTIVNISKKIVGGPGDPAINELKEAIEVLNGLEKELSEFVL